MKVLSRLLDINRQTKPAGRHRLLQASLSGVLVGIGILVAYLLLPQLPAITSTMIGVIGGALLASVIVFYLNRAP